MTAAKDAVVARDLAQQEAIIERGQQTFVEVGNALARIRDERLYREVGFASFDTYCKERWGWTKPYAHRLIASAKTVEDLVPIGTAPANEGQARALRQVPEEERAEVWERVQAESAETGQPVTAARIRAAASPEVIEAEPRQTCAHCPVHCPSGYYSRKEHQ